MDMPPIAMTDILPKLCYEAGRLLLVEHGIFPSEKPFIQAVRLKFEAADIAFRAMPEDDTVAVFDGNSFLETVFAWSSLMAAQASRWSLWPQQSGSTRSPR
jgi:hypothetical protein